MSYTFMALIFYTLCIWVLNGITYFSNRNVMKSRFWRESRHYIYEDGTGRLLFYVLCPVLNTVVIMLWVKWAVTYRFINRKSTNKG